MITAHDLRVMFELKPSGLADRARYDSKKDIPVFFLRDYIDPLGMVAGRNPVATVITADIDQLPVGKTLRVNGVTYTIRNNEPEGDGTTTLLRLQA
jgi:hypothetical protein